MSIQKITSIFFLILHDDETQKLKLFICIPRTEMHAGKKKEDKNKMCRCDSDMNPWCMKPGSKLSPVR